jgi:hypothetical protein
VVDDQRLNPDNVAQAKAFSAGNGARGLKDKVKVSNGGEYYFAVDTVAAEPVFGSAEVVFHDPFGAVRFGTIQ